MFGTQSALSKKNSCHLLGFSNSNNKKLLIYKLWTPAELGMEAPEVALKSLDLCRAV